MHFVTEQLDGGPVILQTKVPIFPGDEEDDVIVRVQAQEHTLYPIGGELVYHWSRLVMRENASWLDSEHLSAPGHATD